MRKTLAVHRRLHWPMGAVLARDLSLARSSELHHARAAIDRSRSVL